MNTVNTAELQELIVKLARERDDIHAENIGLNAEVAKLRTLLNSYSPGEESYADLKAAYGKRVAEINELLLERDTVRSKLEQTLSILKEVRPMILWLIKDRDWKNVDVMARIKEAIGDEEPRPYDKRSKAHPVEVILAMCPQCGENALHPSNRFCLRCKYVQPGSSHSSMVSNCCGSTAHVDGSSEGTNIYVCDKCSNPCDLVGPNTGEGDP